MRRLITLLILIIGATTSTHSQIKSVADYINDVTAISTMPDVKAANDYIDQNHDRILREWIAITEINAPSGHEQQRAKYIEGLLRSYHSYHLDVNYDSAGNLIAVRKGTGGGPLIVFDAHLDTVFQPGLQIKATIKDGKVYAPGIGDDTRNIEALLATIRALNEAKIKTKGDLVFVFTVIPTRAASSSRIVLICFSKSAMTSLDVERKSTVNHASAAFALTTSDPPSMPIFRFEEGLVGTFNW